MTDDPRRAALDAFVAALDDYDAARENFEDALARLDEAVGLIRDMPAPGAPPPLTPPGAWVPWNEFRGEPGAVVMLAVESVGGGYVWITDKTLDHDGRLNPTHRTGRVCLVLRPASPVTA